MMYEMSPYDEPRSVNSENVAPMMYEIHPNTSVVKEPMSILEFWLTQLVRHRLPHIPDGPRLDSNATTSAL